MQYLMPEISFSRRWKLCLLAWVAAFITLAASNPELVFYVWFFPMGLLEILGTKPAGQKTKVLMWLVWLIYLALTLAALRCGKRFLFFVLYGVICLLLILNVVGCQI